MLGTRLPYRPMVIRPKVSGEVHTPPLLPRARSARTMESQSPTSKNTVCVTAGMPCPAPGSARTKSLDASMPDRTVAMAIADCLLPSRDVSPASSRPDAAGPTGHRPRMVSALTGVGRSTFPRHARGATVGLTDDRKTVANIAIRLERPDKAARARVLIRS